MRWPVRILLVGCLVAAACGGGDDSGTDGTGTVGVRLARVAALDDATAMAARPGTDELYVTQRPGIVRRVVVDGDRFTLDDEVVLDVTATVGDVGLEGGLLGIVFAPDGSRVYMGVTSGNDVGGGRRQLVEYTMTDDGIDVASMRPILDLQVEGFVHMGGGLAFGPDGFLYVGLGDGAPFLDGNNTGQDPSDLFASILRIDPLHPQGDLPYSVPEDNPFADGSGAPEVWMFGVRNPWRFSFDADTGDLWIGDVGDAEWEEVDFVPANDDGLDAGRGANLGWSLWEGSRRVEFRKKIPAPEGHVGPLYEYEHGENACAVIGGYVYHGGAIDGLDGTYVFSDLCGGTVLGLDRHDEEVVLTDLVEAPGIVSFAVDLEGELYVVGNEGIEKIVPD